MNFTSEPFLEPEPPTPAHHRRRRRFFPSLTDANRSEMVENLAKRVSPNFDFFLFAILSGAITAIAFLFDSYSLLILAALLAPIMAPTIGLSLAGAIGSVRFFFLSLAGVIVACLLVTIIGALAGVASRIWIDVSAVQKVNFSTVSWDVLIILLLGVLLTSLSMVKSEQKPVLPSAAIAYVIFSTAGGIGFNIGKGNFPVALDDCVTLGIYLMVSTLVGAIIFLIFGFRSRKIQDYGLLLIVLVLASLLIYQQNTFTRNNFLQALAIKPTPKDSGGVIPGNPSKTPVGDNGVITNTPSPSLSPQPSATSTRTLAPTKTSTPTAIVTPGPTPVMLLVDATGQTGARLRERPGFASKLIKIIENGLTVKLLPGIEFKDKVYWAQVETNDGTIGWMVYSTLSTPTPFALTTPTQD
jgi:uncharacterized membrane protein